MRERAALYTSKASSMLSSQGSSLTILRVVIVIIIIIEMLKLSAPNNRGNKKSNQRWSNAGLSALMPMVLLTPYYIPKRLLV